ncbi:MAG: hypothetical protein NVS4B11_29040 [Ktedonobacteraceae bacterium]
MNTLSGYWAMTHDEREKHNALLLDEKRLQLLSSDKRKEYLEALHLHTLIGYTITLEMLNNPDYAAFQEHLKGVLNSLSDRQEMLCTLSQK